MLAGCVVMVVVMVRCAWALGAVVFICQGLNLDGLQTYRS